MSWVVGDHGAERREVRLGVPVQHGVRAHGDDILDPGGLEVRKDLGRGKAGIEPDAESGARETRARVSAAADAAG